MRNLSGQHGDRRQKLFELACLRNGALNSPLATMLGPDRLGFSLEEEVQRRSLQVCG